MSASSSCDTRDAKDVLLDFVDEVKFDALSRHLVHNCRLAVVFIEFRVRVVALIISNLDNAVVLEAALKSGLHGLRLPRLTNVHPACRLEQPRLDLAELVVCVKWTHPVTSFEAKMIAVRWVCEWRIYTIQMPALAAVIATDNWALAEGGLVAGVAQHAVALVVLQFEIVGLFIKATAPGRLVLACLIAKLQRGEAKVPSLGLHSLSEFAILSGRNALKVVSHALRQLEGLRIALIERSEKRREQALCRPFRLLYGGRAFRDAYEAVPWLVQLTGLFLDRRIKACEVEGPIASVAAE